MEEGEKHEGEFDMVRAKKTADRGETRNGSASSGMDSRPVRERERERERGESASLMAGNIGVEAKLLVWLPW